MIPDHLSEDAVAAFLAAVAVGLRDIDQQPPEQRSSTRFVAVVDAALENSSQWSPDLQEQELRDLHRIYQWFHKATRNPGIPGAENFL